MVWFANRKTIRSIRSTDNVNTGKAGMFSLQQVLSDFYSLQGDMFNI